MEWGLIVGVLIKIAAALGVWAHASPHIKNGSTHKLIDKGLRLGNLLAGEYLNNKSHPSP